jgi:beta-mannosidase
MKKTTLSNGWKLIGKDAQDVPVKDTVKPDTESGDWMSVPVPGDVNATLLKYKKIPNPHIDMNAYDCAWVTSKEWWYRNEFDIADKDIRKAELILDGVDGHADLWFNDTYLGEMKNAFHPFKFDIQKLIKPEKNVILIRFKSIDRILGGPRFHKVWGWFRRRAFIRKPHFSFGWDWVLSIPSIGLWHDVRVELDNDCHFKDFYIQPFIDGRVDCVCEVSIASKDAGYKIVFKLSGYGKNIKKVFSRNTRRVYTTVNVSNPKLWFPNGYGEQPLYDYSVELVVNNKVVDMKKGKLGFRESRIVEKPFTPDAGPGFSFNIEINGHNIFCKGGCWIPLELWPATARKEQYEVHILRAKEAGFTMLRVWGGGTYEREIFYELCDKYGIMVWQDFMFACMGYPVDLLRDEIIEEANYQIRRLRNYACIVLWCGINEDIYSWDTPEDNYDEIKLLEDFKAGDPWGNNRYKDDPEIYTMILRGLINKYGLNVPYIESSPESREDYGNMPNSGNCHINSISHIKRDSPEQFRKYFDHVCSFDSEFAVNGPCSIKTFKKFFSPENLWPPNDVWTNRLNMGDKENSNKHTQHGLIKNLSESFFSEIDSFEKFIKYGQAMQSEIVRAEFESARRDRPNNGGTMMWMYNDCWPTCDWSIIDYYFDLKPAYYSAKRTCQPILPIIFERNGKLEFFLGNDSFAHGRVKLVFGQETLNGKTIWSKKKNIKVQANTTVKFYAVPRKKLSFSPEDFLFIDASFNGKKLPKITYFPNMWKNVPWPNPDIKCEFLNQREKNGAWILPVRITTDKFARLCHLYYRDDREDLNFSDNYFDLPAGSPHVVYISSKKKINSKKLSAGHWLLWAERKDSGGEK